MGTGSLFWAIFVFANLFAISFANDETKQNFRLRETAILDRILNPMRYDSRMRPSGINGTEDPVVIKVNTFVRSISKVDDVNREFSVQLTFRQKWTDERLKFNDDINKYLTLKSPHRIWIPDLFFSNEKESHFHNMMTPNNYIRIYAEGRIIYSMRISLNLFCPMNLIYFPFDNQICTIRIASYGYSTNDIVILWEEGDPVVVARNLGLSHFILEKFMSDYCNSKTAMAEYACIKAEFMFKRNFSHYFVQMYLPCYILVLASWISFWLDPRAVTARILLGLTSLLTLTIHITSVNGQIPTVSYTTVLDIWFGVCLTFVFAALLEFATVHYISHTDAQNEHPKDKGDNRKQVDQDTSSDLLDTCETQMLQHKGTNRFRIWISSFLTKSKKIDVLSRIIFPLAFLIFNLAYWCKYLLNE